jgi:SAM-dependent methyltransferase
VTRDAAQNWLQHPELVEFFSSGRNAPDDLYPSERRFLPWLARGAADVLDVGCAAGGFAGIWHAYNPALAYRGVDAAVALVEAARKLVPGSRFEVGDCASGIDMPDRSAEVVQALGWLHWEPRYLAALRELWRLTDRFLFFDVRLHAGIEDVTGEQRLDYKGDWDGQTTTPYITAAWEPFARALLGLKPAAVFAHGYYGPPAVTATGAPPEVVFATFVLERGDARARICLDLPLNWPAGLAADVDELPSASLDDLVPRTEGD